MSAENKSFVFVVCGGKEHIDTLNFSLKALKQFSDIPIVVVTDLQRNHKHIEHDERHVLDVHTPAEFDNHQASIFLKTGLHRFLPMENTDYCYLDSDVVALSKQVNTVFDQFVEPITFCSDHCRMDEFSSSAINCNCNQKPKQLQLLLDEYARKYPNSEIIDGVLKKWKTYIKKHPFPRLREQWYNQFVCKDETLRIKRDRLIQLTNPDLPLNQLVLNYLFRVIPKYKRAFSGKRWSDRKGNVLIDETENYYKFMQNHGFRFNKAKKVWKDRSGKPVTTGLKSYDEFVHDLGFKYEKGSRAWYTLDGALFLPDVTYEIEKQSEFQYNSATDTWYDKNGSPVFTNSCDHLKKQIVRDFNVAVNNPNWKHWNGGVFLFNQNSVAFMQSWHEMTLSAFSLPNWKTRDQGTLIAAVWKHGIQDQPTIPIRYNFIADYNHPTMIYEGNLTFTLKPCSEKIKPLFIHIYHHWGDSQWPVWSDVEKHLSCNTEIVQ